ncbi:hypothetical protein Hanom_Chr12g01140491 [Helianthus anomalus]
MHDPVSGQAVIVCDDAEYRFIDTRDLMCFGAVAQIMNFKLWSGQRTRVETRLFGPYVGINIPM